MKRFKWQNIEELVNWIVSYTDEEGECLITRYSPSNNGYPNITYNGKRYSLRVIILEYKLGRPIRSGFYPVLSCGNKKCVNPEHIQEAKTKDFLAEYWKDGDIRVKHYGAQNPNGKFTHDQVKEIIKMYDKGFSQVELAYINKCSKPYISMVVSGKLRPEAFMEAISEIKRENGIHDRERPQ